MTVTNVYRGWDGNGSFSSWIYRMLSELELVKSQDLMRPIIRSPHRKNVIKFSIFTRTNAFYEQTCTRIRLLAIYSLCFTFFRQQKTE